MSMAVLAHSPIDLHQAQAMLEYVDGADDRETWLAVGMALKAEFGDSAWPAWEQWSEQAANYDASACRSSWRSFKARAGGYTMGTVVKLAKDGGYRFAPGEKPAAAELERRRAERAQRALVERAARQAQVRTAAQQARAVWNAASPEGVSEYARRKGIEAPESCRYLPTAQGGGLVLPMLRYDLERSVALMGLQVIRDDGSKKFTPGMHKTATACRLGLHVVGEPVFVCEGYATGMSIRMALQRRYAVFVAWDAYNLPSVVDVVCRTLLRPPMVICADDDWQTTNQGLSNNVGRIQAQIARDDVLASTGARLVVTCFPVFARGTERGPKDTDFNDLHRLEGLDELRAQLDTALDALDWIKAHG